MFVQRRGNHRRAYDARPRSPTSKYSAQNCSINICGISKRKICIDDVRQVCKFKVQVWQQTFLAEGDYVSTVGLNEATIKKYIEEQEKHDIALDKLSVREYEDPFKGSSVLQTLLTGAAQE